jgi:hypothetical protein
MPILDKGQIVFSDIAFGFTSKRYIEEIFGTWNERYSTSTLLNTPRLMMILPLYIISSLFDYDATILLKAFVFLLIYMSAFSMYLFSKRLVSIYFSMEFDFYKVFALVTGSVFYALNPWVIARIQHIYLLCGYALFPVIIMFYFNIFDPRFQKQMISYYKIEKIKIYKRNILDISLFAIIYGIASAAIHYFFFGMIYLGVVSGLMLCKYLFLYRRNLNVIKSFIINFIIRVILTGSLFICFSGYWFFSYIGSILLKAQASQHNVNVVDTLAIYSRNSSIEKVLYMISYWWPMFNIFDMHWSFYLGGFLIIFIIIYAIIFRGIRHNIILFITVSTLVFFTAATGVKVDLLSGGFIFFVTKVPMIGSMFRDPNKLVGLMAVGYSVLLIIGLQHFYNLLGNKLYHNLIKIFAVCLVIIGFFFYIEPFHKNFIDGFYHPVETPSEYLEIQDKMIDKENFDSKVLYVPIADNMTQSSTGVATPFWNNNNNEDGIDKATGDVHVYTSQKNTIFHHEGNEKNISYFYNYIQYLLDTGKSSNIGTLASAIGVNEFAYHNEYKGQTKRQDFNLKLLELQKGLKERFKGEIFSLFEIKDKLKYYSVIPNKIYTTGSFSKLETFANIKNFNFKDYGVIFKTLKKGLDFSGLEEGDYLEAESFDDIVLSNLPEEYFIEPFNFINEGNAFLKWSKTLIQNSDWMWHLRSQGIENNIFDFDFAGGIAMTYATSEVDIPSYKIASTKGKLVADFNSLLKMEKFFKPDNPELYDIIANPKTVDNSVPLLHGEIVRGDPKNIWQVGKSGMLDAKENNPYKFSILVSGRGSNKMHVKVRFFDEDKNELGMSYVVAPSEEINFNQVKMYGEYVSPKNSKYMRIDLLSYQRPEQKNYWWIHDIKIEDLYKYKKENIFTMDKEFENNTECELFARVFVNKKGGNLKFSIGDKTITIDTFNKSISQFKWVSLGNYNFKKGKNLIEVSNIKGFNSINILAFIPENEREEIEFPVKKAIEKSRIFQTFEIENDFEYSGNIQSDRTYPKLSNGKAVSSQNGRLIKDIDILKESKYYFDINVDGIPDLDSSIEIKIIDSNEKAVYKNKIFSKDLIKNNDEKINVVELDYKKEYPLLS